ncbi:MAG: DEAD/DEAH box helicase [Oscillospiraceae bacterium]
MNNLTFEQLNLSPNLKRAVDQLGFETTTSIQSQIIPIIKTGADVIGRSQTGTGKTFAFAIPAIESIESGNDKSHVKVLVLCPTRELTQQANKEIKKLTTYTHNIKTVEIYGGAPMLKQITQLKSANIVVGTPGRVLDHIRRKTLKLANTNMVVLDEADEMLSMGFKEDIEAILENTPEDRQTVLFSATMPPAIMALAKAFQNKPQLVEINKSQITVGNIKQLYVDVPMGRKIDALALLLKYYKPRQAVVFCNTKRMVDEITEKLNAFSLNAQGLHGDMKQSQRTQVMDAFKQERTSILIATDVAARGIDVKNIDYVINYDIPQSNEYYVHRIGRTGRAGKDGCAITICSGRRQVSQFRDILNITKSSGELIDVPTSAQIRTENIALQKNKVKEALSKETKPEFCQMLDSIVADGNSLYDVAAAMLQLHFDKQKDEIADIKSIKAKGDNSKSKGGYCKVSLSVGRACRIAPNHIVGAIAEKMDISGRDIGKIDIFDEYTIVEMPKNLADDCVRQMNGSKICGKHVQADMIIEKPVKRVDPNRSRTKKSFAAKGQFTKTKTARNTRHR